MRNAILHCFDGCDGHVVTLTHAGAHLSTSDVVVAYQRLGLLQNLYALQTCHLYKLRDGWIMMTIRLNMAVMTLGD